MTETGTDTQVVMSEPLRLLNHISLERWVNVFNTPDGGARFLHCSKQAADEGAKFATAQRVACLRVVIAGQIGDGV